MANAAKSKEDSYTGTETGNGPLEPDRLAKRTVQASSEKNHEEWQQQHESIERQ